MQCEYAQWDVAQRKWAVTMQCAQWDVAQKTSARREATRRMAAQRMAGIRIGYGTQGVGCLSALTA
eukprot:SAG11_NODE_5466_length_1550_cov_10.393939_2_plen_66_part_00